jgi:hypothetical protein
MTNNQESRSIKEGKIIIILVRAWSYDAKHNNEILIMLREKH